MNIKVNMDKNGRLLIPAFIRQKCKFKPGDKFVINIDEDKNEITINSLDNIIDKIQNMVKSNSNFNSFSSEDFIKSRREEYKLEEAKFKRIFDHD